MKQWRIIFTGASDAFFNMALDEAILQAYEKGDVIPTLRAYLWKPPGVSIGYFQATENTVDLNKCKENNIDVVRRITGGRAVLHENEITYSVCASIREYPELGENVNETYQKISFALLESLKALEIFGEWVKTHKDRIKMDSTGSINSPQAGSLQFAENSCLSEPCFISNSRYEITVARKKLIGSAQRRFQNSFIQHGSIPLGKGKVSLPHLLTEEINKKKMKEKLERKSTNLEEILKRKVESKEVLFALKKGFSKFFDVEMIKSEPSKKEIETAQVLREEKYSTEEWNFRKRTYQPKKVGS